MLTGLVELRELGAGAQGRVYLARRTDSGDVVAVKELTGVADERARQRFRDEASLLAQVVDPNVVRIYGYLEEDGRAAIIMEAVEGATLRALLDAHRTLDPAVAATVLKGSLLGLAAAHAVGVVHRDYKPANVLVTGAGVSKLVDFGVAVLAGRSGISGTPAYMAPEVWRGGPASPATDLYSATCVFLECLIGRRPFRTREEHLTAPIPLEGVPEELRQIVEQGLAKDPDVRSRDARAFAGELSEAAEAALGAGWEGRGLALLGGASGVLIAGGVAGGVAGGAAGGAAGGGVLGGLTAGKIAAIVAVVSAGAVATYLAWPQTKERKAPPAVLQAAWTYDQNAAGYVPSGRLQPVNGGYVMPIVDKGWYTGIAGVDGATGKIRWRAGSAIKGWKPDYIGGDSVLVRDGLAVFLKLRSVGANPPFGGMTFDVVAVDAVTGKQRWSYGAGQLNVTAGAAGINSGLVCGEGEAYICLSTSGTAGRAQQVAIELATGKARPDRRPLRVETPLTDGLYVHGYYMDRLIGADGTGKQLWSKSVPELFATKNAVAIDLVRGGGRWLGWSGQPNFASKDRKTFWPDRANTAAFSDTTGALLWRRPGATAECGVLEMDPRFPAVCRTGATVRMPKDRHSGVAQGADVTVEGVDPATGATRWTWHAGAVRGLVVDDENDRGVLRVDDRRYLIRTASGLTLLDLETGPHTVTGAAPSGWCAERSGFGGQRGIGLTVRLLRFEKYWPCTIDRKRLAVPQSMPSFAGVRSGGVYAWVSSDGLHAVKA